MNRQRDGEGQGARRGRCSEQRLRLGCRQQQVSERCPGPRHGAEMRLNSLASVALILILYRAPKRGSGRKDVWIEPFCTIDSLSRPISSSLVTVASLGTKQLVI